MGLFDFKKIRVVRNHEFRRYSLIALIMTNLHHQRKNIEIVHLKEMLHRKGVDLHENLFNKDIQDLSKLNLITRDGRGNVGVTPQGEEYYEARKKRYWKFLHSLKDGPNITSLEQHHITYLLMAEYRDFCIIGIMLDYGYRPRDNHTPSKAMNRAELQKLVAKLEVEVDDRTFSIDLERLKESHYIELSENATEINLRAQGEAYYDARVSLFGKFIQSVSDLD